MSIRSSVIQLLTSRFSPHCHFFPIYLQFDFLQSLILAIQIRVTMAFAQKSTEDTSAIVRLVFEALSVQVRSDFYLCILYLRTIYHLPIYHSLSWNFDLIALLMRTIHWLIDIDRCNPNPCQHGAPCEEIIGGVGYVCQCPVGYKGQICDSMYITNSCNVTIKLLIAMYGMFLHRNYWFLV